MPDGEPFGADRLREFAAVGSRKEARVFVDGLVDAASSGKQEDDLTVVVAEAV